VSPRMLRPPQMSSRPTLTVLISVATILTVGGAIEGWRFSQRMARWRKPSAPVLTREELRRYVTFRRPCDEDKEECEKPLACTPDARFAGYFCLPSECETDWQCQPGFSCTAVRSRPIVRLCYPTGTRQEGERCYDGSPHADESCAPGLICMRNTCGRRCQPDDPASCPRGTACRDSADGYACQPNCAPGDCPSVQRCVRIDDELALCGTPVGANCDESPCGVDQICEKSIPLTDEIIMRCLQKCSEDKPCPEGYSCGGGQCDRLCKKDSDCGPWEACERIISLNASFCFSSVSPNAPP
jgi:hypothetical protein